MQTIEEYKNAIKVATTKKELDDIGYQAFLQDSAPMAILPNFTAKPKTFRERVHRLIDKRLHELGLLEDDDYVPTDDNGNYTDRERLKSKEAQFYNYMRNLCAELPGL